MKSKSALSIVVTSLMISNLSLAESVKPATNAIPSMSEFKCTDQVVYLKLKSIMLPEVNIRPPATLVDAIDFLRQASRDHDDPEIPEEQRGVNLILKLAPLSSAAPASATAATGVPKVPGIRLRHVNLYDALKLVCDVTGMKFLIKGNIVMIVPRSDPEVPVQTRSGQVLQAMHDQVDKAFEQRVYKRLKSIVIPEVTLRPPATLEDAINLFRSCSLDYDDPEIPLNQRGVNLVLMLGLPESAAPAANSNDPFAAAAKVTTPIPVVPAMSLRSISLYDVLKLVCDATGTKIQITGNIVRIVPRPGCEDSQVPARSKAKQK